MTIDRRKFLKGAVATSVTAMLPLNWAFAQNRPAGMAALDVSAVTWSKVEDLPEHFKVLNSRDRKSVV